MQATYKEPDTSFSGVLALPTEVTHESVETLIVQINKEGIRPGCDFVLDASVTRMISASGIQLLLAIEKSVEAQSAKLFLLNTNENVQRIFKLVGLAAKLKKWSKSNG